MCMAFAVKLLNKEKDDKDFKNGGLARIRTGDLLRVRQAGVRRAVFSRNYRDTTNIKYMYLIYV